MMPAFCLRTPSIAPVPLPSVRLAAVVARMGLVLTWCRTPRLPAPAAGPGSPGRDGRAVSPGLARLTVYAIKVCRHYGGGMAVVAASSPEEASRLAAPLDALKGPRYQDPDYVYVLPVPCFGEPRVLSQCMDVDPAP